MKTRSQIYAQEASSLLRDLSMYQALKKEQLLSLYPGKQKVIANLLQYLLGQKRIYQSGDCYFAQPDGEQNIDHGMVAAVWVLIDFIDHVEFHSVSDYPAKLIFLANDDIYEVIHVAVGRETLISHLFSESSEQSSKLLILVDQEAQIPALNIPHATAFCTVSPKGSVQYFQKK